jgi:hypothetical protein
MLITWVEIDETRLFRAPNGVRQRSVWLGGLVPTHAASPGNFTYATYAPPRMTHPSIVT